MTNPERCSCGAREKNKCSKESAPINGVQSGKMCLKDENKAFDELTEKLWKEHPDEMIEAQAWARNFIEEIKNETH